MFVVDHGNGDDSSLAISSLEASTIELSDSVVLRLADVSPFASAESVRLREAAPAHNGATVRVQRLAQDVYRAVLPILLVLGTLGVVVATAMPRIRRKSGLLLVLAASCIVAVLGRIALVGLIEVSAWPDAIRIGYLAPASPFLITYSIIGTYLLFWSVWTVARCPGAMRTSATTE
jgi:hypothetical protein